MASQRRPGHGTAARRGPEHGCLAAPLQASLSWPGPGLGGASARCAAALRGARKCVPSGDPCRAPARRSPASQVSAEGGGGRADGRRLTWRGR